ncbi:ORF344 [White spot syndrome virus]|uniref:Wsv314 n=3 Tax=White spot syndrome virus TaxID=342409 RepID=Q8VAS8_WSSVS|nr:wsv314 [Shrimp white spot syndrome virus]AFX59691.1 wsv314 [White spot syndrome virus]AAL33316.1 wsv314 [Shrimp white spot syndrome virus]AAL89238.1 WSSV370 [Shrimp white spot syndrome virus]ATU83525.1 ORF344 [White spot syndrome virus]AWQ60445.1 wsv314 [Shrimp white spot syndrome virus]
MQYTSMDNLAFFKSLITTALSKCFLLSMKLTSVFNALSKIGDLCSMIDEPALYATPNLPPPCVWRSNILFLLLLLLTPEYASPKKWFNDVRSLLSPYLILSYTRRIASFLSFSENMLPSSLLFSASLPLPSSSSSSTALSNCILFKT